MTLCLISKSLYPILFNIGLNLDFVIFFNVNGITETVFLFHSVRFMIVFFCRICFVTSGHWFPEVVGKISYVHDRHSLHRRSVNKAKVLLHNIEKAAESNPCCLLINRRLHNILRPRRSSVRSRLFFACWCVCWRFIRLIKF